MGMMHNMTWYPVPGKIKGRMILCIVICLLIVIPASGNTVILEAHNKYRTQVGSPPLVWSSTLAAGAQSWADHLAATNKFYHSGVYGENLAAGYTTWTKAVDGWGSEKTYFIYGPFGDGSSTTGKWQDVGHYTQIVWADTVRCGCGKNTGHPTYGTVYVCRYSPPGNYFGQYPYPQVTGATIRVTVPNGGENWKRGTTRTITWKYTNNPGPAVKIVLLKDGVADRVITASTPIGTGGEGSYSWTIPGNQASGTNYKIRIVSTSNTAYKDVSNNVFTIRV